MKGILDMWEWCEQSDVEGKRRKHVMKVAAQVKGGSEAGQRAGQSTYSNSLGAFPGTLPGAKVLLIY